MKKQSDAGRQMLGTSCYLWIQPSGNHLGEGVQ